MLLKWIFDRGMAALGLLVLWPVLLVVAVLIKVKMPGGPAIFTQKRVGRGGKLFTCHKFRTMKPAPSQSITDSALNGGEMPNGWSTVSVAGDTRITPFGAKLRHYKLDELPGLWDVLIGNMSFVGPRPDVPGYADALTGEQRRVLLLRPGITGPATLKYRLEDEMLASLHLSPDHKSVIDWQGKCHSLQKGISEADLAVWYNDNVIYPDKVRINLYYLDNYSFIKDIQMIFCTVLGRRIHYAGEII